ncbi:hypothetical protein BDW59DRAFT_161467 [Aspergillus cavernicola]|uniref:DUF2264 domain protein n=1 Tax=Aspergillus cavernicola TaxID=176166 RepID=A0ABR4IDU9_9EURO
MPPLPGFTDNPFKSRSDLVRGATSLISVLEPYKSKRQARIKLPAATAAGFDETAAQLEGFARPLWVVPLLLNEDISTNVNLRSWIRGLETGTDPESPEYWGDLGDVDQRMVEMESIAVALLSAPDSFLGSMHDSAKDNLVKWLRQINDHKMPPNNWLWFHVFVNLTLFKVLGIPRDEVQHQIDADLETLDSFQIGEGWSSDGLWGDERKQADYYPGSFAIQFAQLLYIQFVGDEDTIRAEKYSQSAKDFGATFWRYFDPHGAAIPFGRSMTYRFAFAAFWSALACADVQLPPPLDDIGTVKGMLLRHLRWWSKCSDIFNVDGTLNIGFTYPNMYMSEGYNSPQSVYWCLKTFIVLMLPDRHPFWSVEELPHPSTKLSFLSPSQGISSSSIQVIWPPRHILCNTPGHHFPLSSGQMTRKSHKAREAKYGKFAYSSAFGFSVPSVLAPDSTLAVSHDEGETWKLRSEPQGERIITVTVSNHDAVGISALASEWRPWRYLDVNITTILIPLTEVFPGWHVRVHRARWSKSAGTSSFIEGMQVIDSGFSLDSETAMGGLIPGVQPASTTRDGWFSDATGCLLRSRAGASGIVDLTDHTDFAGIHDQENVRGECFALRADPNTNLISPRTLIPSIQHGVNISGPGRGKEQEGNGLGEVWLVSGVFAVAASAGLDPETIHSMWLKRPSLHIKGDEGLEVSVI